MYLFPPFKNVENRGKVGKSIFYGPRFDILKYICHTCVCIHIYIHMYIHMHIYIVCSHLCHISKITVS